LRAQEHSALVENVRCRSQEIIERRRICAFARRDLRGIAAQEIRHRSVSTRKVVGEEALHDAIGVPERDFPAEQRVVDGCVRHGTG
jgi:hypothetical protein